MYKFHLGLLFGLIFLLFQTTSVRAEGYIRGDLGQGFYGKNSPKDYFTNAQSGATTFSNSASNFLFSASAGYWFNDILGLDLSAELGPFNDLAATYSGTSYSESQLYGAVLLAPQVRLRLMPRPMDLVLAIPLGYEYVAGNLSVAGSGGSQTFDVSAGTFSYGLETRLELGITQSLYGLLSVGYLWANMPNFVYSKTTGTNGSQALTNALNKNTGADASALKVYLGLGFRWGLPHDTVPANVGPAIEGVPEFPGDSGQESAEDAFYSAEKAFDNREYARAAQLYGQVPIGFSRVAEARTKRGLALWWAKDYPGADQALAQASTDTGEWGKKALAYRIQLRKGMKR